MDHLDSERGILFHGEKRQHTEKAFIAQTKQRQRPQRKPFFRFRFLFSSSLSLSISISSVQSDVEEALPRSAQRRGRYPSQKLTLVRPEFKGLSSAECLRAIKMLVIRGQTGRTSYVHRCPKEGGNLISETCIKYPFLLLVPMTGKSGQDKQGKSSQALSHAVRSEFLINFFLCWSRHVWHSFPRIILLARSPHVFSFLSDATGLWKFCLWGHKWVLRKFGRCTCWSLGSGELGMLSCGTE